MKKRCFSLIFIIFHRNYAKQNVIPQLQGNPAGFYLVADNFSITARCRQQKYPWPSLFDSCSVSSYGSSSKAWLRLSQLQLEIRSNSKSRWGPKPLSLFLISLISISIQKTLYISPPFRVEYSNSDYRLHRTLQTLDVSLGTQDLLFLRLK